MADGASWDDSNFRALLDATTDGIAIHRQNQVLYANHAALAMFGFQSLDQVKGRSVLDFVGNGFRAMVADRIFRGYTQREVIPEIEERLITANDRELPVQVFALPIDFDGGPATLVHIRDLTERKSLELRLRATDRLASLGLVAAGVAHEINTPLTYALCNIDLLGQRFDKALVDDEMRVMLACIRDGVEQAARVAGQVKMLSRPEAWQTSALDVHSVLDWCAKIVEIQLAGRARIVRSYDVVPMVFGNEARLAQVFLNLLLNAVEAMPEGARDHTITLATYVRTGNPVVEVRDTGAGIPPEILARIFEPLFTTKERGTGLGLAICKSLVEEEGGTLTVESQVGRGSIFRVTLRPATTDRVRPRGPIVARTQGRNILIVEDEPRLASTLQHVLDMHATAVAGTGAEALQRLGSGEEYDVILCDLAMPGMDGIELYRRVREAWPGVERHMVFLSGGAFTGRAGAFLKSVPNRCLEKPFEPAELINVIDAMLE